MLQIKPIPVGTRSQHSLVSWVQICLLSAVLLVSLAACENPFSDTSSGSVNRQASLAVGPPVEKSGLEGLDPNLYRVSLTVDDSAVNLSPGADNLQWTGAFAVPDDRAFNIGLRWFYDDSLIAVYERRFGPLTESVTLTIQSVDYMTSGDGMDDDGDQCSNIDELRDPPVAGCHDNQVASDPGPGGSQQAVERVLGTWLSACKARDSGTPEHPYGVERITLSDSLVSGRSVVFFMQHYATAECSNPDGHGSSRTGSFNLGNEINTTDGVVANAIDFQYSSSTDPVRDIVFIQDNNLYLGLPGGPVDNQSRPTALDFNNAYARFNSNTSENYLNISGTWAYINPDKQCVEVIDFRALTPGDNTQSWGRLSARDYIGGIYEIDVEPNAANRHFLDIFVAGDNRGIDCAGIEEDSVGLRLLFYVEFIDSENLNFYSLESGGEPVLILKKTQCSRPVQGGSDIADCQIPSFD